MPQYRRFTTRPWKKSKPRSLLFRLLTFWIPRANPDFEDKFDDVRNFWFEIDDNGQISREIGFDKSGTPLTAAPIRNNLGIFTDEDGAPEGLEARVDPVEFERFFSKIKLAHPSANEKIL